jgi:hypothetical protein
MLTIRQLFPPFSLEEEDDEEEIAEDGTAEKNGKAEEEDNSEPDIILDEFNDLEQTGRKSVNGVDEDKAAGETDQTDEATAAGETDQSDEATAAAETDQSDEATAAGETDQTDEPSAAGDTDQSDEATAVGATDQTDEATAAGETDQADEATAAGETMQSDEATATEREQDIEEKMEAENDPVVEAKPKSEEGQNTEDELELKATPKVDDFEAEAEMDLKTETTKLEAVEQQEPEVKKEVVSTQQTLVSPKTETEPEGNINEASATNESEVEAMDTDERGLVERKANISSIETPDVAPSEKVGDVDAVNATGAIDGLADVKDQEDDIGKSSIESFSKEKATGEESNGFTAAGVATDSSAEMDTSLTLSKDDKVGAMSDQLDYNSASGVGASISTS